MDRVLEQAHASYQAGDHRWVAEVLRHAVFADPTCEEARLLQADAFEQLGYRAESGPWRDVYLTGAQELRNGPIDLPVIQRPKAEVLRGMSLQQIFDFLAVRVDGPAVVPLGRVAVDWVLPDVAETVRVELSNGTLHSQPGRTHSSPDATVTGDRAALEDMIATGTPFAEVVESGAVAITGDSERVLGLFGNLTDFPLFWNVIEP